MPFLSCRTPKWITFCKNDSNFGLENMHFLCKYIQIHMQRKVGMSLLGRKEAWRGSQIQSWKYIGYVTLWIRLYGVICIHQSLEYSRCCLWDFLRVLNLPTANLQCPWHNMYAKYKLLIFQENRMHNSVYNTVSLLYLYANGTIMLYVMTKKEALWKEK